MKPRLLLLLALSAFAEEDGDAGAGDAPEAEDDALGEGDIAEVEAQQSYNDATSVYAYSWNPFRYTGDFLHLAGIVVLLWVIIKRQSVAGLSQKTQILYTLIYCTRYLE